MIQELMRRQLDHDQTKLESPEVEVFDRYTPLLAGSTYGSEEYKQFLAEMRPALEHHYAHNRHHPEYFAFRREGAGELAGNELASGHAIRCMTLVDLLEMLCDWKAATLRHRDGNIRKSLEINQKRFGYGDELKQILLNTVELLEAQAP